MPEQRSRSKRINRKHRKHTKHLWSVVASLLVILVATIIYLNRNAILELVNPSPQQDKTVTTTSTSTSQEVSPDPSQVNQTSSEDIIWEKQAEPVKIPILMYHAIHVMAPEEAANANLIVDPTTFESHLQAFQEAGYYTLTPEEAYKILTENILPKDKKVVWLTFDDSLWGFYSIAYPLLKQYKMKATNNVITGATDTQPDHLTLDQIKEMQENGMSFQSHTVNHPDLEYSTPETQQAELKNSKEYLDHNLHQDTIAVAYPAGRYSEQTIKTVEDAHYKLGVTTNEGLASAANGLLTLNRVRILPVTTAQALRQTIEE